MKANVKRDHLFQKRWDKLNTAHSEVPKFQRIILKATKSDKYDRYLIDIWADEAHINSQLVENGLASAL